MNKRITQIILALFVIFLTLAINAPAEDMHGGHTHQAMDMTESMPTSLDDSVHQGMTTIRETMVNDYHLSYELIDMKARMKDMPDMPPMENTHHLMVFIHSPEGNTVVNAQVGFLIIAPDGEKQKFMAMGMSDGYGADINLEKIGTYIISVKAVFGHTDLRDRFEYEIE